MAALTTSNIVLPRRVTLEVASKLHDRSTIAALSPMDPLTGYTDDAYNYFSADTPAEVIGEGEAKSETPATIAPVEGKLFKVQKTVRMTSEFQWADEDAQETIIENVQNAATDAVSESLDYVVYHAINPKSGETMSGYTALSGTATAVTSTDDVLADWDALIDACIDSDITGVALSKKYASEMRKLRTTNGARVFPEIPANMEPGNIEGIAACASNTVNGRHATTETNVLAFLGDFSTIKWRIARPITVKVITAGDPDGLGDLNRYNQIAYRVEAVFSYAVLDPKKLAVLKSAAAKASVRKATR